MRRCLEQYRGWCITVRICINQQAQAGHSLTIFVYNKPMKPAHLPAMFALLLMMIASGCAAHSDIYPSTCPVAVLADPQDGFHPLAVRIADELQAPLLDNLDTAMTCKPHTLVWVSEPYRLNDAVMVRMGQAQRQQPFSLGLITASDIITAGRLWDSGGMVPSGSMAAAHGEFPGEKIAAPEWIDFTATNPIPQPLTTTDLASFLQTGDYLTFSGHGSNGYWRLDESTRFSASMVPSLDGVVVSAASCQTARPWEPNSIALRFIDQGAAAYAGYTYSPNAGFMMGAYGGLPFKHTWPGFTIADVVLVQNQASLKGFASLPFYHLLGNPFIHMRTDPPYRVLSDETAGNLRILRLEFAQTGILPVRIPDGGKYSFVQVKGVSSAADADIAYNYRLQMAVQGGDRLLLIDNPSPTLEIRMLRNAPVAWWLADTLLDSLDAALLFLPLDGGNLIAILGVLLLAGAAFIARRLPHPRRHPEDSPTARWQPSPQSQVIGALAIGLTFAAFHGLYALLRTDQLSMVEKPVGLEWLSLPATFIQVGFGALLFLGGRRVLGLLTANFLNIFGCLFGTVSMLVFNLLLKAEVGAGLYNYALGVLPIPALLLGLAICWMVFGTARRIIKNRQAAFDHTTATTPGILHPSG